MHRPLLAALAGFVIASFALADDWPNFRGPERNGQSKEKGLLKAWPKGGPQLVWTFKNAGLGHSSFAVVKGVLYTLGTDYDAKNPNTSAKDEYVIAIDEKKGTELWRVKIGPLYSYKGNSYGDGPRSTPTIDGTNLYALGGDGDLVCIDLATKKEAWRKNLVKDLGGVIMDKYGWSESPLIDGKLLICTPGGPNGTLAALDKTNGNVIWRSFKLTNHAPYSSPIVADIHGVRQYIQTSYHNKTGDIHGAISGISADKGNLLWSQTIFTNSNDGIGSTPIVSGNQVYVSSGFGGGCHLFEIDKKQNATEKFAKPLWKKVKNLQGGVVLIDGHVYGHSEPNFWICQDFKTGKIAWDDRNTFPVTKSGAITAAEGMLYLYTDDGNVGLAAADSTAFKLISTFALPEKSTIPANRKTSRQSQIWPHPVIANGTLFLRDHENIFAFAIK